MTAARLIDRLGPLHLRMAAEKGPFTLFALVRLEDRHYWDLLAAAPWIDEDRLAALRYIAKRVQPLQAESLSDNISRIELLASDDERIAQLTDGEASFTDVFGLPVRQAHVLTAAGRPRPAVARRPRRATKKARARKPATKG